MIFNNVNLLSYRHESKFLGGDSVLIGILKTVEINGYILDLVNSNGVLKIVNDTKTMRQQLQQFQDIILNGKNFGRGKPTSFSVDSGNWVRTTQYQATFEILEEVPLSGINSDEFASLNLTNKKFHLLKDLSESFSIDFDKNNKVLNGNHTLDLQFDAISANSDLISDASFLASILLNTLPSSLVEANYTYRTNAITINSENYNLIDGKCGFTKTFSFNNEDVNKKYSVDRENNIAINIEGLVEVSESCQIKVEDNGDYESIILNAISVEKQGAFSRCSLLFNKYKQKFNISNGAFPLISRAREMTHRIDRFNGTGSLEITFDNDEKRLNADFSIERSLTLSRSEEFIWIASETGTITGKGKPGSTEKYQLAQTGWSNEVKPGIENRVESFYFTVGTQINGDLKLITKKISKNSYQGTINYTYEYSDDPQINLSGKKIIITRQDTGLPPLTKEFIIPNNKYTLKQNMGFVQQGTHTVTVDMEVGCDNNQSNNQTFNGFQYFNEMKNLATFDRSDFSGGQPIDDYLESVNFTSDEVEKKLTYEATYKFS